MKSAERRTRLQWALAGAALLALSLPAYAVLGDNTASVMADRARMKGTLHSVDNHIYVMHEITAPSGVKVREYVTPAGTVFGVAWEGQFPPNFQQLLGPYFQQAQQAMAQQKTEAQEQTQPRRRGGPVMVETSALVFVQSGHLHSFHGMAYIPQLVPPGAAASDVR